MTHLIMSKSEVLWLTQINFIEDPLQVSKIEIFSRNLQFYALHSHRKLQQICFFSHNFFHVYFCCCCINTETTCPWPYPTIIVRSFLYRSFWICVKTPDCNTHSFLTVCHFEFAIFFFVTGVGAAITHTPYSLRLANLKCIRYYRQYCIHIYYRFMRHL